MTSIRTTLRAQILQPFRKVAWNSSMERKANISDSILAGPVDEELIPDFDARAVLSVQPGQTFVNKYRVIGKVGWGTASTVWIAENLQRSWWHQFSNTKYVTLKIGNTAPGRKRPIDHELNISPRLERDRKHRGYPFIRTVLDSFEVKGPYGSHVCLVYKPMRESLWNFQNRFLDGRLPTAMIKPYIKVLLLGLDYLHTVCHIIHTDLKAVNIMVDLENMDLIKTRLEPAMHKECTSKIRNGQPIYKAFEDWGWPQNFRILPKIADFGLAREGDITEVHRLPIQPPYYTAPEVMMGFGWSYSADIWNFGVLAWMLQENTELYGNLLDADDMYDPRGHVAEMIALLGPPPAELLKREKAWTGIEWNRVLTNARGKVCRSPQEYYEGPYFNNEGKFMYEELLPCRSSLEDAVKSLSGNEKLLFVDFMKKMLQWLPEERQTAKELAEHPWLNSDESISNS